MPRPPAAEADPLGGPKLGANAPVHAAASPLGTDGDPPRRKRRLQVALVSALFLLVCLGHSALTPVLMGPDELRHVDLVYELRGALSGDGGYPFDEESRVRTRLEALELDWYDPLTDDQGLHLPADAAPDAADRLPYLDIDGTPANQGSYNQLTQHPPLSYAVLASAMAVSDLALGVDDWPIDKSVLYLRLLSALTLLPVPALVYATCRRLGSSHRVALGGSLLLLAVPQLTYVGGLVSNDTLLVTFGALTTWLCARVLTGDRSMSTALGLGLTVGLALLVKAFALGLLPMVAVAYLLSARSRRSLLWAVPPAAAAGAVAMLVGGWWWVRNFVSFGAVQPHNAHLVPAPPDFEPLGLEWYSTFAAWITHRFWGWFGAYRDGIRLPLLLVAVATAVAVVAVAASLRKGQPSASRRSTVVGLVLVGLTMAFVLKGSRDLHVNHGHLEESQFRGIQGRYLFVALPAMAVAAAQGLGALVNRTRWLPLAILGGALAMQVSAADVQLERWEGPRAPVVDRIEAVLAWFPEPTWTLYAWAALVTAVVALLARELWPVTQRPTQGQPTDDQPVHGPEDLVTEPC